MAKPVKKTKKAKSGRSTHPVVMSFRLRSEQIKLIEEILEREPITHVKSTNQFGRKVVADFLAGRLDYKNPSDKLRDLEPVGL